MRFMNEWDIADANLRCKDHPILGPAARTLRNLAEWTNQNSDGWPYWSKPCRSAAKLMELIEGDGCYYGMKTLDKFERPDATTAKLTAALSPIKAFCTRQGIDKNLIISS